MLSTVIHNFPTSLDAETCTEIFTYIIVVFVLVRLSMDELGPEARRYGRFPPSGWLYLASVLFWPITIGTFAGLLTLGLLHAALSKAYALGVWGDKVFRRHITSCTAKSRRVEDVEMGPLVPSRLEGVSWDDAEAAYGCSQVESAYREFVATLKEECGLTPEKWGRSTR